MSGSAATVLHVDLDAFYVSMELLRHPELRGRPVIVAGGLGPRSVVNTCSYEARRFGVRSAMPLSRARALSPAAVVLPSDFAYYGPASRAFHEVLRAFTPVVETAGADEAYLDVAGVERLYGEPRVIAEAIRARVRSEIGITASVGVAVNKLVAKVASDAAKPDGLLVVPFGGEADFLAPRPIRDLPMVGPKTAEALTRLGVRTIGELATLPVALLESRFGPHGRELRERALGRHHARVSAGRGHQRSISRETTFGEDQRDPSRLRAVLLSQAERVASDLLAQALAARTVSIKVRFPPFETATQATSPRAPILLAREVYDAALPLFERLWGEHEHGPVRLMGVGVTNLQERARQLALGEVPEGEGLATTVAGLRKRFGSRSVVRAAQLRRT